MAVNQQSKSALPPNIGNASSCEDAKIHAFTT
jgi:hypothetical protein